MDKLLKAISATIANKKLVELDATTRKVKSDAARLQASANFMGVVNARRQELWLSNNAKNSLGLPAYGTQLRQIEEFLIFHRQCQQLVVGAPWMESGCIIAARESVPLDDRWRR